MERVLQILGLSSVSSFDNQEIMTDDVHAHWYTFEKEVLSIYLAHHVLELFAHTT